MKTLSSRVVAWWRAAFALRRAEPVPDDTRLADAASLHEVERRLREFDRSPWQARGLPTAARTDADAFHLQG